MTFNEWVVAFITPAGILAVVGFMGRDVIGKWIEKRIEVRFDEKLESLRSELRVKEQAFSSDLTAKENKISALRDGVLSGMSSHHIALAQRRLDAAEKLWLQVIFLRKGLVLVHIISAIKMDKALEETRKSKSAREPFERISEMVKFNPSEMLGAANVQARNDN